MTILKKIICADDDPMMRKLISYALAKNTTYEVQVCDSGEALINDIESFMPDLVLLDLVMPGMDGKQTLEKLKVSSFSDIPVIFLTGNGEHESELIALGGMGVITKPFDPKVLAQRVEQLWNESMAA